MRTQLSLLRETLSVVIYQPLDMQYYIDTILHMLIVPASFEKWIDTILSTTAQSRERYRITEREDAVSYLISLRDKAIGTALINGWTSLIRGLINRNNIIGVIASIEMYRPIELPTKSIQLLVDIDPDAEQFISLFTDQPQIWRPTWKKLLATATAYDNPSMIKILVDLPHELSSSEIENLSAIVNKLPIYRQIRIRRVLSVYDL